MLLSTSSQLFLGHASLLLYVECSKEITITITITDKTTEMGDRLAIDTGRKVGAAVPLFGELGPHLTQCGLG